MTELKTLKDLYEKADIAYGVSLDDCEYGCGHVIKLEAIKWVKAINNGELNHFQEIGDFKISEALVAVQVLRRFFNLTNEDLK